MAKNCNFWKWLFRYGELYSLLGFMTQPNFWLPSYFCCTKCSQLFFKYLKSPKTHLTSYVCRLHHSKVTIIYLLKLLHYELGTLIYCALQALFQTMHFFPLLSHFMHIITLVLREDQGYERPHFLSRLQFLSPPNLVIN